MAEGRERAQWNRAAHLMAVIVNCNIDSKKTKPYTPADFNPYSAEAAKNKRVADSNDEARRILIAEERKQVAHGQQTRD